MILVRLVIEALFLDILAVMQSRSAWMRSRIIEHGIRASFFGLTFDGLQLVPGMRPQTSSLTFCSLSRRSLSQVWPGRRRVAVESVPGAVVGVAGFGDSSGTGAGAAAGRVVA
jgi:hypothetical protein